MGDGKGEKGRRQEPPTCPPWLQDLRRAVKVPAGENSEAPRLCSRENCTDFESAEPDGGSRSGLRRIGDRTGFVGGSGPAAGSPPSSPNSSLSCSNSSDWKPRAIPIGRRMTRAKSAKDRPQHQPSLISALSRVKMPTLPKP